MLNNPTTICPVQTIVRHCYLECETRVFTPAMLAAHGTVTEVADAVMSLVKSGKFRIQADVYCGCGSRVWAGDPSRGQLDTLNAKRAAAGQQACPGCLQTQTPRPRFLEFVVTDEWANAMTTEQFQGATN